MGEDRRYQFSWDFVGDPHTGRPHLGGMARVEGFRLFQYTLRDILEERYGTEACDELFYRAGYKAGLEFGKKMVGPCDSLDDFLHKTENKLVEFKMGILRMEKSAPDEGRFVLTVAEDLDCSGLPDTGHTVCTYDEGFLAGLFFFHTGQVFHVRETECWCTGDRTCRFEIVLQRATA